jgi:hypothetical protein
MRTPKPNRPVVAVTVQPCCLATASPAAHPVGQVLLAAAHPPGDPRGDASPGVNSDVGHGSSSVSGPRDQGRLT